MTVILPEPDDNFTWIPAPWGATAAVESGDWVLQCRPLAAIAPHFFTTRALHLRGDSPHAQADWARVAAGIGVTMGRLQRMRQVHGCTAVAATGTVAAGAAAIGAAATGAAGTGVAGTEAAGTSAAGTGAVATASATTGDPEADALMTDRDDLALVVRVADCVPLLMADPRTGAVAAVHAGWRGTAAGIAAVAVRRMREEYGSDPADIITAIGPSIGACCYQVGPEVREAFLAAGHDPTAVDRWFRREDAASDRWRLDGWAANRDQAIGAGLSPAHVHVARLCTLTHVAHFYSYRGEGVSTGRLLGVIRPASAV